MPKLTETVEAAGTSRASRCGPRCGAVVTVNPPGLQASTVFGMPGTTRTGIVDAAADAGAAAEDAVTSVAAPTTKAAAVFRIALMGQRSPSRSRFRAEPGRRSR